MGNVLHIVSADCPIGRMDDPISPIQWPTVAAADPRLVKDDPVDTVTAVVRTDGGLVTVHSPGQAEVSRAALVVAVLPLDATAARVRIAGELDLAVVDVLTDAFDGQLSVGRSELVLDVSGLTFCSCSGLDALLAARHRLAAAGGWLTLTGLNYMMARLLRLTGLETVLTTSLPNGKESGS